MRVAIMQPYFLPYIGYFQLIAAVDLFIVYDNIKFTKKGWINRNRMLLNNAATTFSIPIKGDSDFLDVKDRYLAPSFDRKKLLNQIKAAYFRAPHFPEIFPLIEKTVTFDEQNLFRFIEHSIVQIADRLDIKTQIRTSSSLDLDHTKKGQDRVLDICQATGAKTYINSIGGVDLYSKDIFARNGIALSFLKSTLVEYPQYGDDFVPWLSIMDVMMFNSPESIRGQLLNAYELI